jgi:hypothetical protein
MNTPRSRSVPDPHDRYSRANSPGVRLACRLKLAALLNAEEDLLDPGVQWAVFRRVGKRFLNAFTDNAPDGFEMGK